MKKLNVIPTVLMSLMFLVVISCSVDDSDNTTELNNISTMDQDLKAPEGMVEVTIVIEWHEGVDKEQKANVRDRYKKNEILVQYTPCPEDVKYEEWTINCEEGACARQSDTPVDTDDDVKRLYFEITCVDVKK